MRAWPLAVIFATTIAVALAAPSPPPPTAQRLARGKAVYEHNCAPCHGVTGEGNGPVAFALKPPPRNFVKDTFKAGDRVDQVFATITNGLPNTQMVGYPQIPEDDRWALAYHVVGFRKK